MSHGGALQGFFKSPTSLKKACYKSLTCLLQVSYIQVSLVMTMGCVSGGMDHRTSEWVMGKGSWERGHGVGVMGHF